MTKFQKVELEVPRNVWYIFYFNWILTGLIKSDKVFVLIEECHDSTTRCPVIARLRIKNFPNE